MSVFRDIWAKAILASQELALNRAKGEAAFGKLLETYPNDGMVYYEWGEAYEYLKLFDLAESSYKAAEEFFPIPHWKAVAREGLARVRHKKQSPRAELSKENLWTIFHRIHAVPQIPHKVRVDALSAIARFDSEPHVTAAQLRSCLEELVITLLDKAHISYADAKTLESRIALLESLGIVSPSVATRMDKVRDLGNKGTHPEKRRKHVNFRPIISDFADVIEAIGASRIMQR